MSGGSIAAIRGVRITGAGRRLLAVDGPVDVILEDGDRRRRRPGRSAARAGAGGRRRLARAGPVGSPCAHGAVGARGAA
jgi:hypothetical protein